MQERFSISHKGQELGPFSKDEILQKIKSNELTALDFVFVDSKNDWVPLLEFIPAAGGMTRPPESRPPGGPDAMKIAQPPPKPQSPMKAPPGAQAAQKPQTPPKQNPSSVQPMARPPQTAPQSTPQAASQTPPPTQSQTTIVSRPVPTAPPVMKAPPPAQASPVAVAAASQESATHEAVTAAPVLQVVHNPQPVTKPAAAAATVASANHETRIEAKKGTISLKGGIGTLELLQYTAGTVRLALLDDKDLGLSLGKPEELVVKAAAASKLVLKGPAELSAGQSAAVTIEAHDKWGNRDSSFNGSITAMLSNGTAVGEVKLASGRGTIHFTSTKAETVTVKLLDHARSGLDVSSTWQVQYVAGPAARLVIVTPEETVAGQPIKVEVKALDQFGNLATACNDAVHLEVSAAVKTQQPAAKRQAS